MIGERRTMDNITLPAFFDRSSEEARDALQKMLRVILDVPNLVIAEVQPDDRARTWVITESGSMDRCRMDKDGRTRKKNVQEVCLPGRFDTATLRTELTIQASQAISVSRFRRGSAADRSTVGEACVTN